MASQPSILVLGAGELGTAVLSALAAHPKRTSIIVALRPASLTSSSHYKQAQIAKITSLGIATAACDIASATEDELINLFCQYHTVIGCTGMTHPAGTQLKIARAVLAAKVPRYLPWQFGVDYDAIGRGSSQNLFTEQLDVRDLLRSQEETKWVIVSTGMFMSFLFWPRFGVVDEDRQVVKALGNWENRVTVTTPKDIGRVTAEIVCAAPEVQGVVYTAGQTVSYGQVANMIEDIFRVKVEREEWSVERLMGDLAEDPEDNLKKYRIVFAEGRGVAWDEAKTFNHQRGMKLQGVEAWARENFL